MASESGSRRSQDRTLAQYRKDIKKETGFSTYLEYLEAYRDATGGRHDEFIRGLRFWTNHARIEDVSGHCSIWDIFETGTLSSCFVGPLLGSKAFNINILTSLRNPDSDAILRVILLEPGDRPMWCNPFIINVFGLGLRIVPEVFEAFLALLLETTQDYSREESLGEGSGFLGDSLITVARDYLPGLSMCPPVLLIMAKQFTFEKLDPVVFYPQKTADSRWERSCKPFEKMLRDNLKHYQCQTVTLDVALFHCLLPLVKCSLKQLKEAHAGAMIKYLPLLDDKNPEDAMEAIRSTLRRQVRHFEDCMSSFKRCLRDQQIVQSERYEAFSLLIADSHDSLNKARALESEIRDWLQLRVGSLALQESKKSIENSNLQIEESKRGKIMKLQFDIVLKLTFELRALAVKIGMESHEVCLQA